MIKELVNVKNAMTDVVRHVVYAVAILAKKLNGLPNLVQKINGNYGMWM